MPKEILKIESYLLWRQFAVKKDVLSFNIKLLNGKQHSIKSIPITIRNDKKMFCYSRYSDIETVRITFMNNETYNAYTHSYKKMKESEFYYYWNIYKRYFK